MIKCEGPSENHKTRGLIQFHRAQDIEQPCDFALFHGNLEARKSWAKLPWRQATWLCTLPQNTVELLRWSRFAMYYPKYFSAQIRS